MKLKHSVTSIIILFLSYMISSCETTAYNKSLITDLTPSQVTTINAKRNGFSDFYYIIRPLIIACSDADGDILANISFKDMYEFFEYIHTDLYTYQQKLEKEYRRVLLGYLQSVDIISDQYRVVIDDFKMEGQPAYDYSKLFNNVEIEYFFPKEKTFSLTTYTGAGTVYISFTLPIKNKVLFDSLGMNSLTFEAALTNKNGEPIHRELCGRMFSCSSKKYHMCLVDEEWLNCDPQYPHLSSLPARTTEWWLMNIPEFREAYTPECDPLALFHQLFNLSYKVSSVEPDYLESVKQKVPTPVWQYWEAQEGMDYGYYQKTLESMIYKYVNEHYEPIDRYIERLSDDFLTMLFPSEYTLYKELISRDKVRVENYEKKYYKDWSPDNPFGSIVTLPVDHANGNYISKRTGSISNQ